MFSKGNVPRRGADTDLTAHSWTRRGFFGPYATVYKTRDPGRPIRQDKALSTSLIDVQQAQPADLEHPDGLPMPLVANKEVLVSVSRRRVAMPYCWRNADGDELFFVHQGSCRFETDFGVLNSEPGDLIYLPRNVVYRVIPRSADVVHLILETQSMLEPADRYHRQHGETNYALDMSLIVLPEPEDSEYPRQAEYEVRTKVEGEVCSAFFDYDPVGVTVGWVGDPLVFKLNVWDVGCARLPGPPPVGAVFMTDSQSCVVGVRTPVPLAGDRAGPPAHTNDYDELWFLHSSGNPDRAGQLGILRLEPQGATQASRRQPGEAGASQRGPDLKTMLLNIDVKHRLKVAKDAEPYLVQSRVAAAATT
jgi:homogentisate 1,2-dioxygenase